MAEFDRVKLSGDLEGEYIVLERRAGGVLRIAPEAAEGVPKLTALEKTCFACPAQWEGSLEDGRTVYARYRGGALTVGAGKDLEEAIERSWGEEALFAEHVGDGLDGWMNLEELRGHLYGLLEFPESLEVDEREPNWDPEVIKNLPARRKRARQSRDEDGDRPSVGVVETPGSGIAEQEITEWTCFSCGGELTQAHEGDYFHADPENECTEAIPVPSSLVRSSTRR